MGGPEDIGSPWKHGFDYFFGYLSQRNAHKYYPDFLWENDRKIELHNKVYSHDMILEKALNLSIKTQTGLSFFISHLLFHMPNLLYLATISVIMMASLKKCLSNRVKPLMAIKQNQELLMLPW